MSARLATWRRGAAMAWSVAFVVLLLWPASTVTPAQTAPAAPGSASLVTEFDVNGLKVLVKRRPGSQTVAAGLFLRGGSRNITADDAGIEALMFDLSSEASVTYPRARFRREEASTATEIGFGVNADYSALTLGSTRRFFDRAWDLFTDAALHPSFAPDDFQRLKNQMVVGLSGAEDDPDSALQALQQKASYVGHPYANDPEGTPESVGKLTIDEVRTYHEQMMQTSRLLLVVVGDVDVALLRPKVAATFGKLPRGTYQPTPVQGFSFKEPTVTVTARQIPTNYVQGIFAAPSLTSPDVYPMRIAISVLRDRIFEEVRVRRNLSYAPNAFLNAQGAGIGGIYVTAVDANQAVQVMLNEITRLQTESMLADDLVGPVQQFLTEYYLGQETNAAQAGSLAQYELIGGGWRNVDDFLPRLRAVTPDDVRRVANAYMKNLQFVVLGNPAAIDKAIFLKQPGGGL